ncbi:hypothetical protein BJ912DRAFT_927765 [Pholiota molesta]|nr:hypothetical protein BJ912DRAFT_927765 [Pholiota molesta]
MLTIWSFFIVAILSGAAQVVDASRFVFAFARDNAIPGSRYCKKVNRHTQTPVNAVWLVSILGRWTVPIGAVAVGRMGHLHGGDACLPTWTVTDVVIIMGVFIFVSVWLLLSARKLYRGSIRNIDDPIDSLDEPSK